MFFVSFICSQAFKDLGARKALGVHHDTFPLGIEKFGQPKRDLLEALHRESISPEDFFILEPGQHTYISDEVYQEDHQIGRIIEMDDWCNQIEWEDKHKS